MSHTSAMGDCQSHNVTVACARIYASMACYRKRKCARDATKRMRTGHTSSALCKPNIGVLAYKICKHGVRSARIVASKGLEGLKSYRYDLRILRGYYSPILSS